MNDPNPHLDKLIGDLHAPPEAEAAGPVKRMNGHAATADELRFHLTAFCDVSLRDERAYLVKGLLPKRGVAVVWGPPKCGKSFWATHLSLHVALGWDYRGHRVDGGPVVYCALEGQAGFPQRLYAFNDRYLTGSENYVPFFLLSRSIDLIRQHKKLIADLRQQLGETKPRLIAFDTVNRSLAGDENNSADMSAYLRAAELIAEAFDCCVLLIHHCGWNQDRMRGSSVLYGGAEAIISVKRDQSDNVVVSVEDAKDFSSGEQIVSRLESVEVGQDKDGETLTSCVIVDSDEAADVKPTRWARIPKAAPVAAAALRQAVKEFGREPPTNETAPPGTKAVTIDVWRGMAYQHGISNGAERAKRKAFKTGKDHLVSAGQVTATKGGWCWFND